MVNWFSRFITSSIGKKLIMSLTGLFLIVFLLVHLVGNLQLLAGDGGQAFNEYAYFMTNNPVIKTSSYGLYIFILLHAIQGIFLWRKNKSARGEAGYAVKVNRTAGDVSRISSVNMGALGTVILVFILIHMYQFWLQMKMGNVEMLTYTLVRGTFENVGFVVFYVASMGFIAFHLWHGFQSSFQTLGLNHRKYTPLIKAVGKVYSVLVPLGFAIIPLYMFLTN
jgi:succinate dehydrogenase / fumarate reductase cytochrome b subunit